jgi:hypothetical protein
MLKFLKERLFDMRLLFDYYFPGLPGSVVEFPETEYTKAGFPVGFREKVKELIEVNPDRLENFLMTSNFGKVRDKAGRQGDVQAWIAGCLDLYTEILRNLKERAGGNAFDNRNTAYSGSKDDGRLNREIPRFSSDQQAVAYLRNWNTPSGRIRQPVLAASPLGDPIIPIHSTKYFGALTEINGTSDLYVHLYIDRISAGFNAQEMSELLQILYRWIVRGDRPEPGEFEI